MKTLAKLAVIESALAAILFGAAGRLDLPWFWLLLATHAVLIGVGMKRMDPDLIKERRRPGPSGRDRHVRWAASGLAAIHLVVAGLDVGRFGWSGEVPWEVRLIGLVGYIGGLGLAIWSMVVNRFFSSVVRIQEDRGHHVISSGPYRVVRHPGYAGVILGSLCGGIVLGSWWSLVPIALMGLLFAIRSGFEERFLRERLEGYDAYARQVRHRLLPGVW